MRKLSARGPGPHSVCRKESWVQWVKEKVTKKTLKAIIHESDFLKKKTLTLIQKGEGQ